MTAEHDYYTSLIERLGMHNYIVFPHGQAFIVRHRTDTNDESHIRNINDLADFADLIEWREHQRKSKTQIFTKR